MQCSPDVHTHDPLSLVHEHAFRTANLLPGLQCKPLAREAGCLLKMALFHKGLPTDQIWASEDPASFCGSSASVLIQHVPIRQFYSSELPDSSIFRLRLLLWALPTRVRCWFAMIEILTPYCCPDGWQNCSSKGFSMSRNPVADKKLLNQAPSLWNMCRIQCS